MWILQMKVAEIFQRLFLKLKSVLNMAHYVLSILITTKLTTLYLYYTFNTYYSLNITI